MKVTIKKENGVLILHLKGDLTKAFTNEFEQQFRHELKHGCNKFLVEMDAVHEIDDTGYQILGSCMASAHGNGANFVLYFEDPGNVAKFKESPYAGFFTIVSDAKTAKQELSKPRKKKK